MPILFRCDASLSIGSGHVMRCSTLARGLVSRGAAVTFLCRRQPGDLIALLMQDFSVLVLPEQPLLVCDGLKGRDLYGAWLGCTQDQDASDCLQALAAAGIEKASWLVVDHYGLDAAWEQRMCCGLKAASPPRLLVLDDLADRPHHADVLVDANRPQGGNSHSYGGLVPPDCRVFLGPAFAPLAPLYAELQPLSPARTDLHRLLVFFGSIDLDNHCSIALQALRHPALDPLVVDVVLGSAAPHRDAVQELVRQRPYTNLHQDLPSLAGLMLRADLAIGAAGTASWERVALALPTLVVVVADNQRQGAQVLAGAGAAVMLNLRDQNDLPAELRGELLALQREPKRLEALSEGASALTDGRGLGRLVMAMLGPCPPFRLRQATTHDEGLYFIWANDPDVRQQSFSSEPIELAQHQRWFHARLHSSQALLHVMIDAQGLPLGQIRLERSEQIPIRAVIGFSLDPAARGYGLAPHLLQLGLDALQRHWGEGLEAYGEVRETNLASCKAFLRAGFREGSEPRFGVRCFLRHA